MATWIAVVFAVFGVATLGLVVVRLFFDNRLIPPKADYGTLSVFGGRLKAPVAAILGSAWLVIASFLFTVESRQQYRTELSGVRSELVRCERSSDQLIGTIEELKSLLAMAPVDTGSTFVRNLAFGFATPLSQLGSGVAARLRATSDPSIDLIVFEGVSSLSHDLKAGFPTISGEVSTDYRSRRRFYIELEDGRRWGVNYFGRVKNTPFNRKRLSNRI